MKYWGIILLVLYIGCASVEGHLIKNDFDSAEALVENLPVEEQSAGFRMIAEAYYDAGDTLSAIKYYEKAGDSAKLRNYIQGLHLNTRLLQCRFRISLFRE